MTSMSAATIRVQKPDTDMQSYRLRLLQRHCKGAASDGMSHEKSKQKHEIMLLLQLKYHSCYTYGFYIGKGM